MNDMSQATGSLVGNIALSKVLEELRDVVLQYETATEPSDPDVIDEYQRLLSVLYQALEDARQATEACVRNTSEASSAAEQASSAAARAGASASAAETSAAAADTAAGNASRQAANAEAAAQNASAIMDAAKGTYPNLADRLDAIEADEGFDYEEGASPLTLL